jgi:hypothetical protein
MTKSLLLKNNNPNVTQQIIEILRLSYYHRTISLSKTRYINQSVTGVGSETDEKYSLELGGEGEMYFKRITIVRLVRGISWNREGETNT